MCDMQQQGKGVLISAACMQVCNGIARTNIAFMTFGLPKFYEVRHRQSSHVLACGLFLPLPRGSGFAAVVSLTLYRNTYNS